MANIQQATKKANFSFVLQNLGKSIVKHSIESFHIIILSFQTVPRLHECIFSIDFSVSKDPFPIKIEQINT